MLGIVQRKGNTFKGKVTAKREAGMLWEEDEVPMALAQSSDIGEC